MAGKRKVRIDRIIILILAAILVLGAFGFGLYKVLGILFSEKDDINVTIPSIETADGVDVSLLDYTVYIDDTDKLGFNFIIAKLRFTSSYPVSFDLVNFQTSEKKYLNDVNTYIQLLEENGYKLNDLDICRVIDSTEKTVEANIFIPYTTNSGSLKIYNLKNPSTNLSFDLEKNNKIITSLKFDTDSNIVVDNTSLHVSSSFISTRMKHNNEEYEIPASIKVFTFIITADSVDENVSIIDAYFIKDGEENRISCMSNEFKSNRVENVIGKKLILGENGALFFETYCMEDNPDYKGVLMIKLSNSNDWIKVPTILA